MVAYLLVVGDREALGWILSSSHMAFPSAHRSEVAALNPGDELFLYTTRGAFKNPSRDRGRIIGTAQVVSPVAKLDEPVHFGNRDFPVGCDLKIGLLAPLGTGVELQPLVDSLTVFKGAGAAWSTRLRRPLVRLSDSDASFLHQLLDPKLSPNVDESQYTRWYLNRD